MNYYLTKEAKADGYIVKEIKVPHFGEDYAKIEIHWENGEIFEIETAHALAAAILQITKQKPIPCELCDQVATRTIKPEGGKTSYWCTKHFNKTIKELEEN